MSAVYFQVPAGFGLSSARAMPATASTQITATRRFIATPHSMRETPEDPLRAYVEGRSRQEVPSSPNRRLHRGRDVTEHQGWFATTEFRFPGADTSDKMASSADRPLA